MDRQQECEFKLGERVAFEVGSGKFKATGQGTVTIVRPNGAFVVQPDNPINNGTPLSNIRKVTKK